MDPRLYQWMYGTPNSPGRQQIANASMLAKTMQGVQNADPTALAAYYNVPKGTDFSQFQSHTGAMNPGQADRALMNLPGQSITPQDYYKQATAGDKEQKKEPTSTQIAKAGGEIRGYKKGTKLEQPTADLNDYGITSAQQKKWDNYEKMRNAGKKFSQQQIKEYNAIKDTRTQYAAANPEKATGKTPLSLSDAQVGVTPFFYVNPNDPNDPRNMTSTNPYYNRAVDVLRGMENVPGQYGQAGDAYSRLQNMADYKARDVTGKDAQAAGMNAASMQGREANAAQMGQYLQISAQKADTARAAAAAMNRGDVRDAQALMAQVEKYDAAMMNAPADIKAQAYEAAQAQKNQMAGPQSWTDVGTSQKFMNPYMQNVTDIAKFETMRDYGKQLSQLRSQATGQKAFGGTRAAIQEAEAQRAQQQRMSDIEAQGLNEAYKSGMGQFSAEQGLGLQAGQANLSAAQQTDLANQQALNNQRSQYVTQALEAAKNNYGGQLTAAQANQVADNAARQFNAAAQNTANNNFVAQSLQAQLANQQMDFNVGNLNTQNQQAANMYNAQAQNQANQLYEQQRLAAQQSNQQAGLTTEQQNAQMRQQAELANQLYGANGFNANQQNAQFQQQANQQLSQNQQQANMANQLYGVGGFNAQQANQNAGLQANQQNIGAMGQAGQGLLSVGQGVGAYNQNLLQNWGAAGNTLQNLAQGYYDKRQQSAQNIWGGVNSATQPAAGTLLGSPWGTGYTGQYTNRKKGGKLSIKV
jgi:hypothetical protein